MRGNANPMAMALQGVPQCDKRLDISSAAHDLDDDVQLYITPDRMFLLSSGWCMKHVLLLLVGDFSKGFGELGVEVHVDTAIS